MNIVQPKVTIEQWPSTRNALLLTERFARKAYKSRITGEPQAAADFIRGLLSREPTPHESVVEHVSASVSFICDRGVSHELVRHRLCSFTQESTRYCNYSQEKFGNQVSFIEPLFFERGSEDYEDWLHACEVAEVVYLRLLGRGRKPEEARSILPNSLKTDIVVTANFRQWRHIFALRCHRNAHPQMRQLMQPLLQRFIAVHPAFFDSLPEVETLLPVMDKPEVEIAEDLLA